MRFLILRLLTHSELGMFHEYRRQGREGSKQRAINFDGVVVDRVFPAAADTDRIDMELLYETDGGIERANQWLKRQDKNWRLEGNCPKDKLYHFVEPGCLFVMQVEAGVKPAEGAWCVFPASDPTTKAILADGESSGLAGAAMIALHDDEGEQTWKLLAEARPSLFQQSPAKAFLPSTDEATETVDGVELPPHPSRLVAILASVGHTLPSAVADLVDNSISEDATEIRIIFGRPDGGHGRWMSISDNGNGMTRGELAEAMRIGSDSQYEGNSLGKYGYGLKGASWSQAKVFTVVTKQDGSNPHHLTWDVNDMDGWVAKRRPLEEWERDATQLGRHGTVVLWKDMRPPQTMATTRGLDPYSFEVMQLERHLALVFHRFLEGKAYGRKKVVIFINGNPVEANDPFGHPLATPYDSKSIRIPTETEDGKVRVQAFLLPSEDEISEFHKEDGVEAIRRALDRIGLHGKRNETQGLFIYRHDRLIKWGGWHQMWETNDEKTKLARVAVDFDKVLDEAFKINISKQLVQLPQQLQAEIKKLADVARKDSQRKYRKQGRSAKPLPPAPLPAGGAPGPTSAPPGTAAPSPVRGPMANTTATLPVARPPAPPPRKVSAKEVSTDKFVWKLAKGLTGSIDVQVSPLNPGLAALVAHLRTDSNALSHLADFLSDLDRIGAQQALTGLRAENV